MFLRRFATSARSSAAFFARTVVAPGASYTPQVPTSFQPKSVVLLSTPQNLASTIESALQFYQLNIQVVVAGVDRVVPNGTANGVSELWLEDLVSVGPSTQLSATDKAPATANGAKVNWKQVPGMLHLGIGAKNVGLSMANTAFATNTLLTLFYLSPKTETSGSDSADKNSESVTNMGQMLSELTIQLPDLQPQLEQATSSDRWTPLTQDKLVVTKCTGNLVKSINDSPAAQFLEKNTQLMALASKDTKVYVKVYDSADVCRKYEVIAGGGGWGAKADLLALSPEAVLSTGDRVEFYMITPNDRFDSMSSAVVSNQFLFECVTEATSYESSQPSTQTVENLFGAGSEEGFVVDGVNYKSPGETVSFRYSPISM